ncbi:unnamed protein product [Clonostachys rosea]|uniref:Nucleoside phosphorylase domain-containing protein n=1 Tax=Bionectria ochroleuca TaxID=29856 RepID=A0ABY6UBN4_BIOOC|nr:unnamed protein product [Clonostachys rosea]
MSSLASEAVNLEAAGRLSNEDYHVGIVCALATELVAIRAFFEELHEDPITSIWDHNIYKLGRIGSHCVVAAVMPASEYGTSSAAGVARDMLRSFPNIRLSLTVGIGGGVPNMNNDIRLGDVVVASDGIIPFDMTKQGLLQFGQVSQPPKFIKAAVASVQTKVLQEDIRIALERWPRLAISYKKPATHTDQLYKFEHGDSLTHEQTLVERPARDGPVVHYGSIASGNCIIKDAMFRDKLAKKAQVLCLEMEAADTMSLPSLAIRGICDYADSHRNDTWQKYAALTAAAYSKNVLKNIPKEAIRTDGLPKQSTLDSSDLSSDDESLQSGERVSTAPTETEVAVGNIADLVNTFSNLVTADDQITQAMGDIIANRSTKRLEIDLRLEIKEFAKKLHTETSASDISMPLVFSGRSLLFSRRIVDDVRSAFGLSSTGNYNRGPQNENLPDSQADEEDDGEVEAQRENTTDEELQLPAAEIDVEQFRQVISGSPIFQQFLNQLYNLAYPSTKIRMERLMLRWRRQRRYPDAETRQVIAELIAFEPRSIKITTKQPGWSDWLKGAVEAYAEERWDWWPLAPICHPLEPGQVNLSWSCVSYFCINVMKENSL